MRRVRQRTALRARGAVRGPRARLPASGPRADEEIKVIGMRRRIAQNMSASKRNIPHFTYVDEVDVTDLEAMRAQLNEGRGDKPKLTILPLLITAICQCLPEFPMINATYDDEAGVVTRQLWYSWPPGNVDQATS